MKHGELPKDPSYVLRLLEVCRGCASALGLDIEQTAIAIGNQHSIADSTERNIQVFTPKGRFVFDGGNGEPHAGAVDEGGDPIEAGFLRRAFFKDGSLAAPNAVKMPYSKIEQWFTEKCEEPNADVFAKAQTLRDKLEKLRVKVSGVVIPLPRHDHLDAYESLRRKKRYAKFRNDVISLRQSTCQCDACDLAIAAVIDAAHVHQVFESGDFQASNGLLLCRNHHKMWDEGLFGIDADGALVLGKTLKTLGHGIIRKKLPEQSFALVDKQKLAKRWLAWKA